MSDSIPCPACGSPIQRGEHTCEVCGFHLGPEAGDRGGEGSHERCGRCGAGLGEGFQFCQVCGLEVGLRAPRPETQRLQVVPQGLVGGEGSEGPGESPAPAGAPSDAEAPRRGPRRSRGRSLPGMRGPITATGAAAAPAAAPSERWDPRAAAALAPPAPRPSASDPLAGLGASPLRLVVINRDGSEGQAYFFPGAELIVGRAHGDLQFPSDDFLSPRHARLELRADGLWIVDLQSINGVFVRVDGSVAVYPGDVFLLGHQLLRLENVPEPPPESREGVRIFGTPLDPAWACLSRLGLGGAAAERYFLRGAVVVLGREEGDIIYHEDAFISRQHAQLGVTVRGNAMHVSLTDLSSANGTYVRIRGEARLEIGAMFRVGDQVFRVRTD